MVHDIPALWYKVRHPEFDPRRAYRLVDYVSHSETAWAQLVFVLEDGKTWAVQVSRCTCLSAAEFSRDQDDNELAMPWAEKPEGRNPDLDVDL